MLTKISEQILLMTHKERTELLKELYSREYTSKENARRLLGNDEDQFQAEVFEGVRETIEELFYGLPDWFLREKAQELVKEMED